MNNQQKVAIVTGASRGIGAGLVKAFRDRDYRVVANARSIQPSSDPGVLAIPGDIADRSVAQRIIAEALAQFGRIDTLVNNAGIFTAKPFTSFTLEDYANNLAVNLDGFFHITQLAIAEMEKQGSGHVVSITTSLTDHAIDGVPSVLAALIISTSTGGQGASKGGTSDGQRHHPRLGQRRGRRAGDRRRAADGREDSGATRDGLAQYRDPHVGHLARRARHAAEPGTRVTRRAGGRGAGVYRDLAPRHGPGGFAGSGRPRARAERPSRRSIVARARTQALGHRARRSSGASAKRGSGP